MRTVTFAAALLALFLAAGCRTRPDTALAAAASRGDIAEIERLVAAGSDINSTASGHGLTALMVAARSGRVQAIHTLIRLGANAEAIDRASNGWTAMMHAVHKHQIAAVRALLDEGADPDHAVDEHQYTPLIMAAGYGYTDIVELLLAAGADPRKTTVGGYNALAAAVGGRSDIDRFTMGSCQTATVKALLKAAPDLRVPDNAFGKAARWASWFGNCAEIKQLLAGGAPKGR